MKNPVREKILSGKKALGTFMTLGSADVAEALALAGLDYIIIDGEHGPFAPESALSFARACEKYGVAPFVRTPNGQRQSVLHMLEIGALGLVVPFLSTVAEVQELVSYAKYPPLGMRGCNLVARQAGFGFSDKSHLPIQDFFDVCNRETLLLPQCETAGFLENIEEICALPGVDGIFIGPYDLSVALGVPAQVGSDIVLRAIDRVLAACKQSGKMSFIFARDAETASRNFGLGFDSVTCTSDGNLLVDGYKKLIGSIGL